MTHLRCCDIINLYLFRTFFVIHVIIWILWNIIRQVSGLNTNRWIIVGYMIHTARLIIWQCRLLACRCLYILLHRSKKFHTPWNNWIQESQMYNNFSLFNVNVTFISCIYFINVALKLKGFAFCSVDLIHDCLAHCPF